MRVIVATAMILAVAGITGCSVESHKHGDGSDVKIATPFGGMNVKTNETDVLSGIGLPAYPGATIVRKKDNDGAADINMSFGSFQLRVKAAAYRSTDSPEKVLAFYKKALNRFGSVIQCDSDKRPVGTPVRTDEGLTCSDGGHEHDGNGDHDTRYQLKAGSKKHQHIVDISSENGGVRFGLVSLDLPLDFRPGTGNKDDQGEKEQ
jgi:hypothetical protein